jgi:ATP-dependent RNA circularization protein (DNA/RNA ligase family)
VRNPVVVLMGVMLLFVAIRQSYGFSVADAELIKQYRFMYRIFRNARQRIEATDSDEERRRVLRVLGEAALGEHAQWILMHRERSLEHGEIWRMGS